MKKDSIKEVTLSGEVAKTKIATVVSDLPKEIWIHKCR